MHFIDIAPLPMIKPLTGSPELVQVLDKIRFGPLDKDENSGELTWFIREYPRVYRHHYEHANYRLQLIHGAYQSFRKEAIRRLETEYKSNPTLFSLSFNHWGDSSSDNTYAVYWNFESYFNSISAALDALTRVIGTAYKQDTPPNFNRFCKTAPEGELKEIFCKAKARWVRRMKAYRDCFIHYTSVDTILFMSARLYSSQWQVRANIPVNPQAREILAFRYSRQVELLSYSVTLWNNLRAFDRAVIALPEKDATLTNPERERRGSI